MKKLIVSLIFFFLLIVSPYNITAYEQVNGVCYSQCAAYKFVWQGDYCYDLFKQHCSAGSGNGVSDTIKFLKSAYDVLKGGQKLEGLDTVFKAWFVCKPLIENCIAPQLQNCRATCDINQYYYAPNLSVGHPDSSFHGVYYDKKNKQLYFKLINNGLGYAWDIDVEASFGHTKNRDNSFTGGQQLFKEKVEHLIYLGARNGPPKTLSDNITDFLIDEAMAGQFFQGFKSWLLSDLKSDSKNYNVPNYWIKAVSFQPVEGELNRIIFNVDSSKLIPESNENDNTYIFDIDFRPAPASFTIDSFSQTLISQTLNSFMIGFKIKNHGEESGTAQVRIYEGEYKDEKSPIFSTSPVIMAESSHSIDTIISIDSKKEVDPYCGQYKEYTIVVTDDNGNINQRKFSLPIYIGSVSGRVEDLFGNKIVGVTIKTSSGEETTTNKYGYYHLKNINTLGKVSITATHPEYSKSESKEVNLQILDSIMPCQENGLIFTSINFVLKDQDVMFKVTVKDRAGNMINAHLIATGSQFRIEKEVSQATELDGLQPGQYFFTISAPGYKTIGQTVNAVPNDQNLVFILDRLNGRPNDATLSIHQPILLWEKNLGQEIYVDMRVTKDGKTAIFYTSKNKPNTGKLYFINALSGSQKNTVSTIANGGNSQASIDTSYDGDTTALCSNDGKTYGDDRNKNWLKLFNASGSSLGQINYEKKTATKVCEVSPDGFFIYPYFLTNKGFYQYTLFDTQGKINYKKPSEERVSFGSYQGTHITSSNSVFGLGKDDCDIAIQNLDRTIIHCYQNISSPRFTDSSQDGQKIVTIGIDKAYLLSAGQKIWVKNVKTNSDGLSIGISPGGNFIIYNTYKETVPYREIKIFTANNIDKTPSESQKGAKEDVVYVSANDKGIFYASLDEKKLKFFQVGSYSNEYNPEVINTPTGEKITNAFSYYENGQFHQAGNLKFSQLIEGLIYKADQTVTIDMENGKGSLFILSETIFSIDRNRDLVLLKGQMTADFSSPAIIYAIKFDRYDLELFRRKLGQLIFAKNLPEDEYFIVKNIHTKWTIKNNPNEIKIMVDQGEVKIIGKNINESITSGRQIRIDKNNQLKKGVYFKKELVALLVIVLIAFVIFIIKKNKK